MDVSMKESFINDFTDGSIPKKLLRFIIPFMLSNGLQVLYSLVDMIIVGRYVGSLGLSAVSVASQVSTFMTVICLGISTGGQIFISQLIGCGERQKLCRVIGTVFSSVFILSLVLSVSGLVFSRQILLLLDTPAEAFAMAESYLLVCSAGMVFSGGYNMVAAVLRGMGDSKRPFVFILIASVINLVLDVLFVVYLDMSVFGAALATIIGQAFSFIYAMAYLYRNRNRFFFDFLPKSFAIDSRSFRELMRMGLPLALQNCAINFSMLFVIRLVNGVDAYATATLGVGLKLDDIINKVTLGINYAVSAMVGQNFAAGSVKRVRQTVYWGCIYALAAYAAFTVVYLSFSCELFGVFTDDMRVVTLAPVFTGALVWSFPAMILMRGTVGFVQGIGNTVFSFASALLDSFVFRILLCYVLGIVLNYGLFGLFLGYGLGAYGTAIPTLVYFLAHRWELNCAKHTH